MMKVRIIAKFIDNCLLIGFFHVTLIDNDKLWSGFFIVPLGKMESFIIFLRSIQNGFLPIKNTCKRNIKIT